MGTTDRIWFRLECPKCGATDESSATEKGSVYGGFHWRGLGAFPSFDTRVEQGPGGEPNITSATCNSCGTAAEISSEYGTKRPDDL